MVKCLEIERYVKNWTATELNKNILISFILRRDLNKNLFLIF